MWEKNFKATCWGRKILLVEYLQVLQVGQGMWFLGVINHVGMGFSVTQLPVYVRKIFQDPN